LGFIVYDLFFKALSEGHIYGIETRAELVEASRALAQRLDFKRMVFLNTSVAESSQSDQMPAQIDVVTALHACDTATDDAIAFGLLKKARAMVLVPCCQAEVAAKLRQNKALNLSRTPLAELWRHPLHTREIGSQLTNVLRCLYLESKGYTVTVTELVGWEHSMKKRTHPGPLHRPPQSRRRRPPPSPPHRIRPHRIPCIALPLIGVRSTLISFGLAFTHGSSSSFSPSRLPASRHAAGEQSSAHRVG
jgi:hypothetical protein